MKFKNTFYNASGLFFLEVSKINHSSLLQCIPVFINVCC